MAAAKKNTYTLKRKIRPQYTKEQIKRLADDLINWAENAKDIHMSGWSRKQKKTTSWLHELAKTHPEMKAAKDEAMILLGRKVLNSSFYGSGNATVGMAYLPVYDKDFRDLLEWKAGLQKQTQDEIKATADEVIKAIKDDRLLDLLKQKD